MRSSGGPLRSPIGPTLGLLALAACGRAPTAHDTVGPSPASSAPPPADAAPGADGGDAAKPLAGPAELRLLFIGNSYTQVNDLPAQLTALAATGGVPPTITTEAIAPGGATFEDHWKNPAVQAAITRGTFSHVVLQGQSLEPLGQPQVFGDYGVRLGKLAKDAGATPAYYETWARAPGDPIYAQPGAGGTPDGMQDGLLAGYTKCASLAAGVLLPVGEAWRMARAKHPSIALHQADGSHPTVHGTLLAAYVMYDVLAEHDVPEQSAVPAGVTAADAALLRAVARAVVRP